MTTGEKNKLRDAMNELSKTGYENLLKKLVEKKVQINFRIDPVKARYIASFWPPNDIYFKNYYAITANALREELIHAAQCKYYGFSMTNEYRNYDFEAKLYQDIMCVMTGKDCPGILTMGMLDNTAYCDLYDKLILSFRDGKESFNRTDLETYNKLGEQWDQYPGIFDPAIEPKFLLDNIK